MSMQRFEFELFADYFQFYIQDELAKSDLVDLRNFWSQEAIHRRMAVSDGMIAVGTARNMTVPVDVELHETPPPTSFEQWDQVNECSIETKSGRLVVAGCTDYFPDAERITVAAGTYRARIFYGNLDSVSDDRLDGEDRYLIQLWRAPPSAPVVLKCRPRGPDFR